MSIEKHAVSVVVIAKNEAHNLPRLLSTVSWADEILVADTGSNDDTAKIASEAGAKVINLEWEGFGLTKQRAVAAAANDWILSLDADECLSPELQKKIIKLKQVFQEEAAYRIKRVSWYLNKKIRFCGWQSDMPIRLFNRKKANFNDKVVHEGVKTSGEIRTISATIFHYTYPHLADHLNKINLYSGLNVKEKYKPGKKYSILGAVFQGFWKFIVMYFIKFGFLDGKIGFLLSFNSAYGQYLKYIKLWERRFNDLTH